MKRLVNRVDHVVYLSALASVETNISGLEAVTGAQLVKCERADMGALICVDWSAGLEIVAPLQPRSEINEALHHRLETHGEGLLAVVFGVADLEAHRRQLESQGHSLGPLMTGDPIEPWYNRLVLRERFAPPIMDSWLVLSQIDYAEDVIDLRDAS